MRMLPRVNLKTFAFLLFCGALLVASGSHLRAYVTFNEFISNYDCDVDQGGSGFSGICWGGTPWPDVCYTESFTSDVYWACADYCGLPINIADTGNFGCNVYCTCGNVIN